MCLRARPIPDSVYRDTQVVQGGQHLLRSQPDIGLWGHLSVSCDTHLPADDPRSLGLGAIHTVAPPLCQLEEGGSIPHSSHVWLDPMTMGGALSMPNCRSEPPGARGICGRGE